MQSGKRWAWTLLATLIAAGASPAFAEDSTTTKRVVPEIRAYRINPHPPSIDGNLDDPIWQSSDIDFARGFTQRDTEDGAAETESTVVAIAYDDEALYVAFWCYDSEPDKIQKQLVRRDRHSESDLVVVRLDPYHDHLTGNQFYLNAAGVQIDGRIYNDDWTDDSWDGVWDGAIGHYPWGWAAEYRIPYHNLRFKDQADHVWGVNFARLINRTSEVTWWSYIPQSEKGFVSAFGHMTGLTDIKPSRRLEVLPYGVSKAALTEKEDGNPDGRDYLSNTGVDIKYGLSSNLTLDATFNPDFGQVELDEPVLNLTAFETWFPEKRPFFIEGADLFQTQYQLFYSRRIGRSPTGGIDDDEHIFTIEEPQATSILGAAKLTGKIGGTSIAFLNAVTQEEHARYSAEIIHKADTTWDGDVEKIDVLAADTVTRETVIEPKANYSVLRVKRDVLGNSHLGGMVTLAAQETAHPEMTGAIDWRLLTKDGGWAFYGQSIASRVDNENIGFATDATISKEAGKHIRGSMGTVIKDPHFHINKLGFTSRNDFQQVWGWWQYRTQDDWWKIRNSWNNINYWSAWNYDGYNISLGGNFNNSIELTNNWWVGMGLETQAEKYSDLETRGNGVWEWPTKPTFNGWLWVDSDKRKKLAFEYFNSLGTDRGGDHWETSLKAILRPRSNLEFNARATYRREFDATRWLLNDDLNENDDDDIGESIFADLDRNALSFDLTASVMLARNLSWQISGQGLISTLDYRDHKRYLGGGLYARDVDSDDYADESGTFSAFNSMMIVRWEYMPGSTIFFVWTRARDEFDDTTRQLQLSDEFDRLFSRGAENIWLLKVSYWWNL